MKAEIRQNGSMAHISGYVNAVERDSRVLSQRMAAGASGDFVERVAAGAFSRAIGRNANIRMLFNHGRDIGGVSTGELKLTEDNIGLRAEADITDPEVVAAAKNGELRGWSFGFTHPVAQWTDSENSGIQRRTLTDFDLLEVSVLTKVPAYVGTSIEMRSDTAEETEFRSSDEAPECVLNERENAPEETEKADFSEQINRYKKEIAAVSCRRK